MASSAAPDGAALLLLGVGLAVLAQCGRDHRGVGGVEGRGPTGEVAGGGHEGLARSSL